jgi:hypothetical protein
MTELPPFSFAQETETIARIACDMMRQYGGVSPVLHVFGVKGEELQCALLALSFPLATSNTDRQDQFQQLGANFAGLVGDLYAIVHVSEAWSTVEDRETGERTPRQESLLITGLDTRTGDQILYCYEMVRGADGAITDLPLAQEVYRTSKELRRESPTCGDSLLVAFTSGYCASDAATLAKQSHIVYRNATTGEIVETVTRPDDFATFPLKPMD